MVSTIVILVIDKFDNNCLNNVVIVVVVVQFINISHQHYKTKIFK
jgi:hypothetical protein